MANTRRTDIRVAGGQMTLRKNVPAAVGRENLTFPSSELDAGLEL